MFQLNSEKYCYINEWINQTYKIYTLRKDKKIITKKRPNNIYHIFSNWFNFWRGVEAIWEVK